MAACPDCGEKLRGRYRHEGRLVCWPCWMKRTGLGPLLAHTGPRDPDWVAFRKTIGDALDSVDASRFAYIDEDRHVCPVCQASLPEYRVVRFHGQAPRATIHCSRGCPDDEIAETLGIEVVS